MKNYIILLLFSFPLLLFAQDEEQDSERDQFYATKVRHVKGSNAISVRYGYVETPGHSVGIDYLYHVSDKVFLQGDFGFEKGRVGITDYNIFDIGMNGGMDFFDIDGVFFFSGHLGMMGGIHNLENKEIDTSHRVVTWGPQASINAEIFLVSGLSVYAYFREIMSVKNPLGEFRYRTGFGIRYYIK